MKRKLASVFVVFLLSSSLLAQSQRGTWTARQQESGKVNLSLQDAQNRSNFGQTFDIAELEGLSPVAVASAAGVEVTFQLVRDAGRLDFQGRFRDGLGHGEYTFHPDAAYMEQLRQLGFAGAEVRALSLAMVDVSLAYAREFAALGLGNRIKQLIEGRIFNVDRAFVESLRTQGMTDLSLKDLVQARIFKIDADYVQQRRAAGQSTSVKGMVESKIHKATPEFAAEMAAAGYPKLSDKQLVEFRIHGVSPEFVRELREAGLKDVTPRDLVQMRIFGVNGEFVRRAQAAGHEAPTPRELVRMKIHGVSRSRDMI
jgi:hypothetical protein